MAGKGDPRQDSVLTSGSTQVVAGDEFAVNSADLLVKFCKYGVQPPSQGYLIVDDVLQVAFIRGQGQSGSIMVNYRILRPDGTIVPGQETFGSASDAVQLFTRQLEEGYLLSVSVQPSPTDQIGDLCYAVVSLIRGASSQQAMFRTLCAGYVYNLRPLTWPEPSNPLPADGQGQVRTVTIGAPGAGLDWSQNVPNGERWQIQSVRGVFTTAVAVANREVQIVFAGSGGTVYESTPGPVQAASLAWDYSFGQYGYAPINTLTTVQIHFDNTITLPPGGQVKSVTTNLQAADAWSAVNLLIRTRLENQ